MFGKIDILEIYFYSWLRLNLPLKSSFTAIKKNRESLSKFLTCSGKLKKLPK